MPGGGITSVNCHNFKEAGFYMVHASATEKVQTLRSQPNITMHSAMLFEEGVLATSQMSLIQNLKAILTKET
jgi:copper homeostasis protein CutC